MVALDIPTLVFAIGIVTISLGFCMFYFIATQKTYPGFLYWAWGFLIFSTAFFLISIRGKIPDFISIVIANTFVYISLIIIHSGFVIFAGKKQPYRLHLALALIVLPAFLFFAYGNAVMVFRTGLMSLSVAIYFLLITHILFTDIRKILNQRCSLLITVTLSIAIIFGALGLFHFSIQTEPAGFSDSVRTIQSYGALVFIILMILFVIGLIQLNYQRLEMDFNNSYKEIEKAMLAAEKATVAKSEFLANMSHEIRTPMNGVVGMLDLLMESGLEENQQDYAKSAQQSADSLLTLINDILDFSKMEAGMMDIETIDFDLSVTIESICDLFAVKAHQKGIKFACLIHQDVPEKLKGDPGRLRQILTNLAGNALKFTEEGEIFLKVTRRLESSGKVELMFEVRDTGIGIPKNQICDLFESFNQADTSITRKYGGTGLGLAISKQLVALMSGEIGAKSHQGKGSTFWFTALFNKQQQVDTPLPAMKNIKDSRILIVDDNLMNHEIFSAYLSALGCITHSAYSGEQALRIMLRAEKTNPFQVVLIDMQMPEMDGEELGRKIKYNKKLKNTIMIMISSIGNRGDVDRLKATGFSGFLNKPVKKHLLQSCVQAALAMPTQSKTANLNFLTRYTLKESDKKHETANVSYRILLVEDNAVNQKVATKMLEKMGHTVNVVPNGLQAVEFYQKSSALIDLILMDIQMPVMGGEEATRKIRALEKNTQAHVPIIALTANAMTGDREQFLGSGMDDYLSKPVKKKDLINAFSNL